MKYPQSHLKQMWIWRIAFVALVIAAFGCATPASAPPGSQSGLLEQALQAPARLKDIRVVEENGSLDLLLVGKTSLAYTAFKAIDPLRLVVDLPNTVSKSVPSALAVENAVIGKIHTTMPSQKPRPLTRVEIGLNREVPYKIIREPTQIRIHFEKPAAVAKTEAVKAETAAEAESKAAALEAEVPKTAVPVQPAAKLPVQQAALAPLPPATRIVAIEPEQVEQGVKVAIAADGKFPRYQAFPLLKPPRLVLDIMGVGSSVSKVSLPFASSLLKDIRVGSHKDKIRLVFDLLSAAGVPYWITTKGKNLIVSLEPGAGFPAAETKAEQPKAISAREIAKIKGIAFNLLKSGKSRLAISADRPVKPEIQITGAKSISLVLANARLPSYLQRYIDTSQFASAVNLIDPRPMEGVPNAVEFRIELREMVPYHVARQDNKIYLDFDPSTAAPPKPIQLSKPVTVAEKAEKAAAPEAKPAAPAAVPAKAAQPAAAKAAPVVAAEALPAPGQARVYTGKPISLDFQDVDIRNVLRLLADISGKNIVVEPEVQGRVTLKLNKVPWDQVLDLILKINNLDRVTEGNVIRIATAKKLETERKQVEAAIKAEQKRLIAARDQGRLATEYLQVNYADAQNISGQIEKIKSDQGSLSVDSRTNLIIYTDFPKRIETAKEILAKLDRPTPQVMIEARIVEASTNFSRDLGIQWGGSYTPRSISHTLGGEMTFKGLLGGSNFAVDAPVGAIGSVGLSFARTAGTNLLNLDLRLSALETTGEGRIIASPRIFTLDGVSASIEQGKDIPVPVQTEDGISTEYKSATLSLKVTPHITPDEKVRLEVEAAKDEPDFGNVVNGVPAITTRKAQTELLVSSGDTIVIGGVVTQTRSWSESRVPFFARIPLLSWLFKSRQVKDDKTELLIFLSPTIIKQQKYTRR